MCLDMSGPLLLDQAAVSAGWEGCLPCLLYKLVHPALSYRCGVIYSYYRMRVSRQSSFV